MGNPTDNVPRWNKSTLRVWLKTAISTPPTDGGTSPGFTFPNVELGPWFMVNRSRQIKNELILGQPGTPVANYWNAGSNPSFSLTLPFSPWAFQLFATSLMQTKSFSDVNDTLTAVPYTDPTAKWFLAMEIGYTGSDATNRISLQVTGAVCRELSVTFPEMGEDGGEITLTGQFEAYEVTKVISNTAFLGTPPAIAFTSAAGQTRKTTFYDFTNEGGPTTLKIRSYEFTLSNALARSMNAGEYPDGFNLGPLTGTGAITAAMSLVSGTTDEMKRFHDNWNVVGSGAVYANHINLKTETVMYGNANLKIQTFIPVLFQEAEAPAEGGNVMIQRFPFDIVQPSASYPAFVTDFDSIAADPFATWA